MSNSRIGWYRIAWTIVACIAAGIALSGQLDGLSRDKSDDAFKNALVTFAAARALNGVISVAQGTELALEPGGVGVVLTLGQILDPINDLVERFSAVMLVATSALGLQNILIRISAWWGLTALVVGAGAWTIISLWWSQARNRRLSRFALPLLLAAIFLRFSVPTLVLGTQVIFDNFLANDQLAATQALEKTSSQIEAMNKQSRTEEIQDQSIIERLSNAVDSIDPTERIERLRKRMASSVEDMIMLIVIFTLQTILLPIGFLWLFIRGLKSIAERATRL